MALQTMVSDPLAAGTVQADATARGKNLRRTDADGDMAISMSIIRRVAGRTASAPAPSTARR